MAAGEQVWRSGRPLAGALGDILLEAGVPAVQVAKLCVEKVYGVEPRTDITITPLK